MLKRKLLSIFLSFVLLTPVIVAGVVFIQDNLDGLSDRVNCFNIQEEEEDSEEETKESNVKNSEGFLSSSNLYLHSEESSMLSYFLRSQSYSGFEMQVQVPPPELA